eukprot:CAMPEP_0179491464 /NCGR_PEP_ID=MMETSP0799-20121207/66104_1 /TAXON_ID=46947 /ORGANISM="Geminigera cryophila, Strain CCMP2564" /LENGTH=81 /DNA_ID=CAMNT_0021307921 /DNA_START=66 /DNA_END=311 /DNA_ORIENTATION=-
MRKMSGMPGKEQMNAAAARAGDQAANLGASLGENVQKLQWWTNAKLKHVTEQLPVLKKGQSRRSCKDISHCFLSDFYGPVS